MSFKFNFSSTQSLIFLIAFCLGSCGLKYIPSETPEEFELKRHSIVENYIQNDLTNQNITYASIAFGETIILKPESFKKLDSLHAVKYFNEQNGKIDPKLEDQIEIQRIIVQHDTNKVSYIEDHVFSLTHGDSIEFYSGLFQLDQALNVKDVTLKESIFLPKRYSELYKIYLLEESFFYPGNLPTGLELNFYTYYKNGLQEQVISERDAFILHTLKLMEFARIKYSINTVDLMRLQVARNLPEYQSDNYVEKLIEVKELNEILENGEQKFVGYSLKCSYTFKPDTETQIIDTYQLTFDQYLRLIDIIKL